MNAQNNIKAKQSLSPQQQSIVSISALTAVGNTEQLKTQLNTGLDAGLTINEVKEVLVQLYAYCGFPRSLNAINIFMSVIEERKAKGITDVEGKEASAITATENKYETGKKTLQTLTGQEEIGPKTGAAAFAPAIDTFLKEHLFADIFSRDVLTYQQRELATIAVLSALDGVASQLEFHLAVGLNSGFTEAQLKDLFSVIEAQIGKTQAEIANGVLEKITDKKLISKRMAKHTEVKDGIIFPKGEKNDAYAKYFIGQSFLNSLVSDPDVNLGVYNVTFEPGCHNNWHIHHDGYQILLVTGGEGWYQEDGKPAQLLKVGDVILTHDGVKHWHGATKDSWFVHLAITAGTTEWLEPVADEVYNAK